jgi:hypothetical protein
MERADQFDDEVPGVEVEVGSRFRRRAGGLGGGGRSTVAEGGQGAAADALPSPPSSSDLRRGENSETGERLNVVMDCVLFVISARSGGILFDTRLVNSFLK